MTFIDPQAIFLTPGKVNPLLIGIYRESELVTRADEIFDQLARGSVNDAFPAIVRPSLLPASITAADIKRAYHALWVSRQVTGASWKPRPNLDFYVAMVLERRDGALLTVIDESLQVQSLPHDYDSKAATLASDDRTSSNRSPRSARSLAPSRKTRRSPEMRGRKPKPTRLKLLTGNPGKRPLNLNEPQPEPAVPDCPPELSPAAQREWARLVGELGKLRVLTHLDRAVLAAYCGAYALWAEAIAAIGKFGVMIKSPTGFPIQSPYLAVANRQAEIMMRIASEFGFTPASRGRISAPSPDQPTLFDHLDPTPE